ncbi:MAG: sulfotransferase [Desulfobacterales bacterium]|nr:sulfotransferase [Desulfobacterales bacterium]
MKNKAPIFLNCLSRGGSNIFWNIFLSHPDACSPIRETLEIFRTNWRDPHWEGYVAALLSGQPLLFDQWKLKPRRPVSAWTKNFIDATLYRHKLRTFSDPDMRFKAEGELYTRNEVHSARLVTKNNNGLSFLSDMFSEMYPDATFFALLRDPVPLYESHLRRNIFKSPQEFAAFYNRLVDRAVSDQERFPCYHIIRFEDILSDPQTMIPRLHQLAGLDPGKVDKVRFRAKPHFLPDGTHGTSLPAFDHYWFALDQVYDILEPGINRFQEERIARAEREQVADLTREHRERFCYA